MKQTRIYDAITEQKMRGVWNISLALSQRMQTLDFYYHIYQALEEFEPERTHGYRARFCYNEQICSTLWGGVSKVWNTARYRHSQKCHQNDGADGMDMIPDNIKEMIIPSVKGIGFFVVWFLGLCLYGYTRDKFRRK